MKLFIDVSAFVLPVDHPRGDAPMGRGLQNLLICQNPLPGSRGGQLSTIGRERQGRHVAEVVAFDVGDVTRNWRGRRSHSPT
jgi:hypothetical protein